MHLTTRNVTGKKRLVLVGFTPAQRLAARTQRWPGEDSCWVWTGHCSKGYGRMTVAKKGVLVHRLAYELSVGPIPGGLDVLHTCDNPKCVRPSHLFLGNDADNMTDKTQKGRQARGQGHGNAKLTEDAVKQIKSLYRKNVYGLTKRLANQFGVTETCIRQIITGERWSHLGG